MPRNSKGHQENPLVVYKSHYPLTWAEIAELSGLTVAGIYTFIKKSPKELLQCELQTALLLKKKSWYRPF